MSETRLQQIARRQQEVLREAHERNAPSAAPMSTTEQGTPLEQFEDALIEAIKVQEGSDKTPNWAEVNRLRAQLCAALAPLQESEPPLRWMLEGREGEGQPWVYCSYKEYDVSDLFSDPARWRVTPLFASPRPAPVGLREREALEDAVSRLDRLASYLNGKDEEMYNVAYSGVQRRALTSPPAAQPEEVDRIIEQRRVDRDLERRRAMAAQPEQEERNA